MQSEKSYKIGVIATLVGGVCWGFSGASGQYLFTQKGLSADYVVSVRLITSGLIMLAYSLLRYGWASFGALRSWQDFGTLCIYGIFGLILAQWAYFYSIELSNAAVATTIQYSVPAFLLAIECLRFRRLPSLIEIVALVAAMGGVFLLSTHASLASLAISPKALAMCLLCIFGVIVYTLAPTNLNRRHPLSANLALAMILGGAVLAVCVRAWELDGVSDASGAWAMASVVVVGTVFAFGLFMYGVSTIGAAKASLLAAVEPVAAAVFSAVWLGDRFVVWDYAGFGLILACIWLLRKG
ncbi:DMT family transporter [Campylobacter sp. 19-13652]|uniref:DMT family transporter n=1 Tax=Campylobacter sp. 19-13652 TaxID=2840180 RepID=UPI001C75C3A3|nr:DMT family transporter [Campylobacter sp. 19-13652]BCX78586.1 EamA family transporter [Campylobacter sp. 19-13652]